MQPMKPPNDSRAPLATITVSGESGKGVVELTESIAGSLIERGLSVRVVVAEPGSLKIIVEGQ